MDGWTEGRQDLGGVNRNGVLGWVGFIPEA